MHQHLKSHGIGEAMCTMVQRRHELRWYGGKEQLMKGCVSGLEHHELSDLLQMCAVALCDQGGLGSPQADVVVE